MNIQEIYNTQLVQKDKNYIHTCTIYVDIIIVIRSSIHEVVKQAEVKRLTQTSSTNLKEQL